VNCSRALKWFLVLLLPLMLGWKLFVHSIDASDPNEKLEARVAAFLVSHQFSLVGIVKLTGELPVVRATGGPSCRMLVALTSPRGWHRDMLRTLAAPSDRTFVVFRGNIYSEQPMLLTVGYFLWSKFLSQLGLKGNATPVLAVIATKECDAERLPWRDLG
jgi:hypothetical protein